MTSRFSLDADLKPEELQQRILNTYINVRVGIGVLGMIFPFFLWLVGRFYARLPLRSSISMYYHAVGYECRSLRDWFVGVLFVVGIFLFLYKGFSRAESWALSIAGALAVGVAIFPMSLDANKKFWFTLHGSCAIGLFLCMAFVVFFCADDTLALIHDTNIANPARVIARLKLAYRIVGLGMALSVLAAYILNAIPKSEYRTFWVETAGICSFGIYWLLKSWELRKTDVDLKSARGLIRKTDGKLMSIAPKSNSPSQP